jgi:hypothetical protein
MAKSYGPVVIWLNDPSWGECPLCEQERRLTHAVAWYCGPTHDEIGAVSTEYRSHDGRPAIVGGKTVCKECHDGFYPEAGAAGD